MPAPFSTALAPQLLLCVLRLRLPCEPFLALLGQAAPEAGSDARGQSSTTRAGRAE